MSPNVAGTEAKLRDGIAPSVGPHPLPLHSALSGCGDAQDGPLRPLHRTFGSRG